MQPMEHSEFPLWCWRSRSGGRSGCLERKGEERGYAKKGECHEIFPRKFLLQKEDGESNEDGDGDDLLNDLELKSRELDIRSEEHTSELQSPCNLVCRLLLEKKKKKTIKKIKNKQHMPQ